MQRNRFPMHLYGMKQFFRLVLLCLLAMSCVETIVMDPKEEKPFTILCVLNDTTDTQIMRLFYPGGENDPGAPVSPSDVHKAELSDRYHHYPFSYVDGDIWEVNLPMQYSTEYHLTIELTGSRFIEANTTTPNKWEVSYSQEGFDNALNIFKYAPNDFIESGPVVYWISRYQILSNGDRYYSEFLGSIMGGTTDSFNRTTVSMSDVESFSENHLRSSGLGEETGHYFFDYIRLCKSESVSLHWKSLRINQSGTRSDDSDEGSFSWLYPWVIGDYDWKDATYLFSTKGIRPKMFTEIHFPSTEYDMFLKRLYKKGFDNISGDLMQQMFDREGLYSNIEGGFGIFGAESIRTIPVFYGTSIVQEEDGSYYMIPVTQ